MTTRKTIALTRRTFYGKVISLFFNMLSRLLIAFLTRSQMSFDFMAAVTICSDFGAQENEVSQFPLFPHILDMKWWDSDAMIFISWMLSFKPAFSLTCFTFIKRLLSSSSLVVSSAYLRLLVFLLAILIPAYASSSLAFPMICSEYKLNNQGDNIQPWCTPFPICNQPIVPCLVLTVAILYYTVSNSILSKVTHSPSCSQ